jgi:hypothetical protein
MFAGRGFHVMKIASMLRRNSSIFSSGHSRRSGTASRSCSDFVEAAVRVQPRTHLQDRQNASIRFAELADKTLDNRNFSDEISDSNAVNPGISL